MKIWSRCKENVKERFSYKGKNIRDAGNLYTKYLTKRKLRLMGVRKITDYEEYTTFTDCYKNEMVIVELDLRKQNGSNQTVEEENYRTVMIALDEISGKAKIIMRANVTNRLDNNVTMLVDMYEHERDREIKEDILERLVYTQRLNQRGEVLIYLFIQYTEMEQVLSRLSVPFHCKVMNHDEMIKFLFALHNQGRGVM